jgi:hypothetical protein
LPAAVIPINNASEEEPIKLASLVALASSFSSTVMIDDGSEEEA